ncbi:MAG: RNase adapter RapZ [Desulfosarcina sp.]|nr:RNase adapter RapZ [Desulfobacterales bacterium]
MIPTKIIIITGLSGSGKSTAIDVMEDAGYYCVDNMPVALLPKFLEMPFERTTEIPGLAFGMDVRQKNFIGQHPAVFAALREVGYRLEIFFLEASSQALLRRYSQTRRYHPMGRGANLAEVIQKERAELAPLRARAQRIIDSTDFTVHQLKAVIREWIRSDDLPRMQIHVMSFGFKYGLPPSADLVIDVRFLANPYFQPELKALDGESSRVRDFVLNDPNSGIFIKNYFNLLDFLIPLYEKEGKAYLTIAVGCTGGHHRSVTMSRCLFEHIRNQGLNVEITHRDIGRQPRKARPPQTSPEDASD